ncbi:MAG: ferrous iron transport protein B [Ruminococcus sp.]|nr:ferrous iron transport protein B [Ruminococcus sp.]
MIFALAGNQNCGKTTLFNLLTGSHCHTGNFPGVTVEGKSGEIRGREDCTVTDLPGIYSIRPYSAEETVARDYLLHNSPDCIINIADASNIERNLYLTLQLAELNIPMVLALNMMDEVEGNGGSVDVKRLSLRLGFPVVPVSAAENKGIEELIDTAVKTAEEKKLPARIHYGGSMENCIMQVRSIIGDKGGNRKTFFAVSLMEKDETIASGIELSEKEQSYIESAALKAEKECGLDRWAAIADMRYSFIEKVCRETVVKGHESKEHLRSLKIDRILTDKFLGLPMFGLIMAAVFYLTFGLIGAFLSDMLSAGIGYVTALAERGLDTLGVGETVRSLIIDGIFAGVGSVLGFLPTIVTLFFFLSVLEDSGYMARAAFIMDRLMRKIGLSGRSFVPMVIGFGCSVPAVMATRTLSSERDRRMTILLIPFMSCSAKLPVYSVFSMAFFPGKSALVMCLLYFGGIACSVIYAKILSKTKYKGEPAPFVMELPNYRFPSPKCVLLLVWEKAKDFITKAFTIIFAASVIIWFLQTFDGSFRIAADSSQSMLARIGMFISPVFAPLGFGDWRVSTSLLAGFTAKEAVVSTLSVLTGATSELLPGLLRGMFTPASAASFLTFSLLYTPCAAAVSAVKREIGTAAAIGFVIMQCAIAWLVSAAVYFGAKGLLI